MRGLDRTLLKVAGFSALSAFLLGSLVVELGQVDLTDRYELSATFDDVQGLLEGDTVKLAGVGVGRVTSIEPVEGRAHVRFEVDHDVALPTDSEASIRWRNLLGQRYLYLDPGTRSDRLEDGDEVTETRSVVDLGELFNELGPLARVLDPDQVNELVTSLGQALGGNEAAIDGLLDDLGALLQAVASRDDAIAALLADADTLAAGLASRDAQIRTMIDNLLALARTFEEHRSTLGGAVTELANLSDGLDTLLTGNAADLDAILAQLAAITGTAAGRLDLIEDTLATLPLAGRDLFDAFVARGEVVYVNVTCFEVGPPPCDHPTSGVVEDPPADGTTPQPSPAPADDLAELLERLASGATP